MIEEYNLKEELYKTRKGKFKYRRMRLQRLRFYKNPDNYMVYPKLLDDDLDSDFINNLIKLSPYFVAQKMDIKD